MTDEKEGEVTPGTEPAETLPEPTMDGLQKAISDKDAEILRLNQTVSKHAEGERKLKDQTETLAAIHGRLDTQEDSQATILDYLDELRGTPTEEPETSRKSHRDQLAEKRKDNESKGKAVSADPDVAKFIGYMEDHGLKMEDSLVVEAVAEDRSPKDALKYLRDKVGANRDESVDKRATEIAQGLLEQKLKELGLTKEPGTPSAPTGNWQELPAGQKILRGVSQGK